jgi:hypothetical protein
METGPVSKTFSSYLEFQMMDEVLKPSDFQCYTPLPEPFDYIYRLTSLKMAL